MHRSSLLALAAITAASLVACGEPMTDMDAATDAGRDAGTMRPDTGPRVDSGPPDGGPPPCSVDCGFVELALGVGHSCARRANGEVWCWGANQLGQLGDNRMRHQDCAAVGSPTIDCSSTAVRVLLDLGVDGYAPLTDAVSIAADGAIGTCAVRESGQVWCWGLETIGQVGDALQRFAAVRVEDFGSVSQVTGWEHRCMIQGADDRVVCFGSNSSGQLGLGLIPPDLYEVRQPALDRSVLNATNTGLLTGVVDVLASGFGSTTCARTATNLYCWGSNRDKQFGDGATVHEECTLSGQTDRYSCDSIPVEVPITNVADVALGWGHVCALDSVSATVRCWGDNRAGQAGQDVATAAVDTPTAVSGLTTVAEVAAGGRFSCARLTDGTIQCWGFDLNGELGDGTMTAHGLPCTIDEESADCTSTPVPVATIDDATHIAVGVHHACAIRASGEIWCWGGNSGRQLGDGTRETRYGPVWASGLP